MEKIKPKKHLGHSIWFKVVLTIILFLPSITQFPYSSQDTTKVVVAVMSHPFTSQIPVLFPISKVILLLAVILPFVLKKFSERVLLGYYCTILFVVGIFQNMAYTDVYGFAWLLGNTLVQFAVLLYCLYDLLYKKSVIKKEYLNKRWLWVLAPMLLAFLMPFTTDPNGVIKPYFGLPILWNEAGLTYCMITPVVIGMLLIFSKGIYKPVLSVVSYVGLLFGILNMMTWFGFQSQNWWMGILHLPLLVLSFLGLVVARREKQKTFIEA